MNAMIQSRMCCSTSFIAVAISAMLQVPARAEAVAPARSSAHTGPDRANDRLAQQEPAFAAPQMQSQVQSPVGGGRRRPIRIKTTATQWLIGQARLRPGPLEVII